MMMCRFVSCERRKDPKISIQILKILRFKTYSIPYSQFPVFIWTFSLCRRCDRSSCPLCSVVPRAHGEEENIARKSIMLFIYLFNGMVLSGRKTSPSVMVINDDKKKKKWKWKKGKYMKKEKERKLVHVFLSCRCVGKCLLDHGRK